jgi:hypothetical protein
MADFLQDLKSDVSEALTPVFRKYQGSVSLADMRDTSVNAVREYFYFGLQEKLCHQCGWMKSRHMFGTDSGKPDGLFAWCKECRQQRYNNAKLRVLSGSGG